MASYGRLKEAMCQIWIKIQVILDLAFQSVVSKMIHWPNDVSFFLTHSMLVLNYNHT